MNETSQTRFANQKLQGVYPTEQASPICGRRGCQRMHYTTSERVLGDPGEAKVIYCVRGDIKRKEASMVPREGIRLSRRDEYS